MASTSIMQNEPRVEDFRFGYPRFCALIAAYPSLNVFRRFSKLRARIILRKQDALSVLEQQLDVLDREEPTALFLASYRLDDNGERQAVLDNIETTLKDYDDLIQRQGRMLSSVNADPRDVSSLENWLAGNRCLARTECSYLSRKDLFSASEKDGALVGVESFVEDVMIRHFTSIYRRHCDAQSQDPNVFLSSGSLIGRLARILIAAAVIVALLVPMLICSYVTNSKVRVLVVSFAIIISITILVMTVHIRTIEVIVVGTTYATVLTVFVSATGSSLP